MAKQKEVFTEPEVNSYFNHFNLNLKFGQPVSNLVIVGFNPNATKSPIILGNAKTHKPVGKCNLIDALVRTGNAVPKWVCYQYYSEPIEEIVNILTPWYKKQGLTFKVEE